MSLRDADDADGAALASIYNYYIEDTIVTFEEERVTGEEMARRVREVRALSLPWLVAETGGELVGYAYAARWRPRAAYRFAVEITVYLRRDCLRRGLGSELYAALFERLAACGIHAVLGGIALPNDPSIALHEKFGLTKVAHLPKVGWKFGRWIDVGYWQKNLPQSR